MTVQAILRALIISLKFSLGMVTSLIIVGCSHGPEIPMERLVNFYSRQMRQQDQSLLQEIFSLKYSNLANLENYISSHRPQLRQILPALINQVILAHLTGTIANFPLTIHDVERMAATFEHVHHEPAPHLRIRFLQGLSPTQKQLNLEAEFKLARGDSLQKYQFLPEALVEFQKALSYYQKLDDHEGQTKSFYYIGLTFLKNGDLSKSLDAFEQSYDFADAINDPYWKMQALVRKGIVQFELRNYRESELALNEGIDQARLLEDRLAEASAIVRLGRVYQETGYLKKSITLFHEGLTIYENLNDIVAKARTLSMLGYSHESMGNYAGALQAHKSSLRIYQQQSLQIQEAAQLTNIGNVYKELCEYDHALAYHKPALEIFKAMGTPTEKALANANLAAVYSLIGKSKEALELLNIALNYLKNPDYSVMRAQIYQIIGETELNQGNIARALEALTKAMEIYQQNNFQLGIINGHIGLGKIDLIENRLLEAESHFDTALRLAIETGASLCTWEAYHSKGLAQKARGNFTGALSEFRLAIDTIEAGRYRIQPEQSRLEYLADKQNVYDDIVLTYLEAKDDAGIAFNYVERAKARSFLDFLAGGVEFIQPDGPEDDTLIVTPIISCKPSTYQEIQQVLQLNDRLIEYRVLDDRVLIWLLDQKNIKVFQVAVDRDTLCNLIDKFRRLSGADSTDDFKKKFRDNSKQAFEAGIAVSRKLTKILIDPVWPYLTRQDNVYIVPDNRLHYLPFAALMQPGADNFLIEVMPIAVIPSGAILKYALGLKTAPAINNQSSILVIADPGGDLPFAQESGQAITRLFKNSRLLLGQQASKEALAIDNTSGLSILHQFDIIHFGTHCFVNEDSPLYSRLQLASTSDTNIVTRRSERRFIAGEENINLEEHLLMHEIFNLKLYRTHLVVLSACKTALGRYIQGEGLVGLSRAFMCAGANNMITTLWSVDDRATARMMTKFYQNLISQKHSICQALRLAQMDEINRMRVDRIVKFPHPYFWAAFVITGIF